MNELYLCINTDLVPHDLVHIVWNQVFENWFQLACAATNKGEFLVGDLADDTKLDGRGKLPLADENQEKSPSQLASQLPSLEVLSAILERLDSLELTENPQSSLEISCIGQVPSGFRVTRNQIWYPCFSPSFNFIYGKSSFDITLFDPSWNQQRQDVEALVEKLVSLVDILGSRRVTQIEFEVDGQFLEDEELWRLTFAELPLAGQNLR